MIRIEIATDSDAFGSTPLDASCELARLLRRFAYSLELAESVPLTATFHDLNGNAVGTLWVEED